MLEYRIIEMMAEERIRESREAAARAHLLRERIHPSISPLRRFAVSFAAFLITAGTVIQERSEPLGYREAETDCSTC